MLAKHILDNSMKSLDLEYPRDKQASKLIDYDEQRMKPMTVNKDQQREVQKRNYCKERDTGERTKLITQI
jgi:hypothetical protein